MGMVLIMKSFTLNIDGLFSTAWTFSFVVHQRHAALKVLLVNVMCHLAGTP